MKKEWVKRPEIKLAGLSVRTNNKNEMNPNTSKIGDLINHFQKIVSQIANRKAPGLLFSVYTEYESNEHGEYTYFIGEEVHDFESTPTVIQQLGIPSANYQKFTTSIGKMPQVLISAWQEIWKMNSEDLGGQRAYQADFEVYDERARDPANTCLDIYIGVV